MRRILLAALALGGCGSSPTGAATEAGSTTSSTTQLVESTTEAHDSFSSGSANTTGGATEDVVEGVWRWLDGSTSPFAFQTCDGEWLLLGAESENGSVLPVSTLCSSRYVRLRGSRGVVTGVLGSPEGVVIKEVIEERFCQPGDCGQPSCEPRVCLTECEPFEPQCPLNTRCVPYSPDGTAASSARCVPIPAKPIPLGGACTKTIDHVFEDDCGSGATCLGGHNEREGVCVPLCEGTVQDPTCPEGICSFGAFIAGYCLPECDPEAPGCAGTCLPLGTKSANVCVPEVGIIELLERCGQEGCGPTRECSLRGATQGYCVPSH